MTPAGARGGVESRSDVSAEFFVPAVGPLNQGDILIAPIARVAAPDLFVPDKWDRLDQDEHHTDRSAVDGEDIFLLSGRELVMVTSHDCHHDKEWNTEVRRLVRAGEAQEDAETIAEANTSLDRNFHASPLVPLTDCPADHQGNLRAGKVVGYFPIPASSDGSFPDCVVDLTYRCTVDRLAISNRRWCLSQSARDRLRYAIARFDSFRSVELSEQLESAIGREITDVQVDKGSGIRVTLTLDDGTTLDLVQPPAEPEPGGRTHL